MRYIKIYELFNGDVYEVKLVDHKSEKEYSDFYKYSFRTKNDIEYRISFFIKKDGTAKLDFMTEGKDPKHNSFIQLINTGDAIKVFNTLKSIIEKHRQDIKKLIINSSPDRVRFYKRMLDHMKIRNELDPTYAGSMLYGYLD